MQRRELLLSGLAGFASLTPGAHSLAAESAAGEGLRMYHIHTSETLEVSFRERGLVVGEALAEINHFLRDFRSGEVHDIDLGLLDTLGTLYERFDRRGRFEIISGFRSPRTNEALRRITTGVAKDSFHLLGQAIDVRLTGADTADLRDAALELARGGVGYYPGSNFVHLDTGRVRAWQG